MKPRLRKQNKHKSFTLIELLIAVIIVGIIASMGVGYYRKAVVKAKAGKAKHAISLIAEAEKIWQIDNGSYVAVGAGAVDVTVGTNATGMNLAAVDNDTDFTYSVTDAGLISGSNTKVIGTCVIDTVITLDLPTGVWSIPACYR